jgi:CheY-like chemotaxis protein
LLTQSLTTAFEWNRAAKSELEVVRRSLRENIRISRQRRSEWYCSRLRAKEVSIPTILVAEDEPALLYAICRFLSQCGLHVLDAGDGAAALRASRDYAGAIDLLLTDIAMPYMDGLELATAVSAERPGTDILLMTAGDLAFPRPALRKPFELDDLLAEIVGLLIRK